MSNETARVAGIIRHSSVDGPGVRFTVFLQGCPHDCPGCHNPDTHDPMGGTEMPVGEIIAQLAATKYLDGITLSGGDPFTQPAVVKALAEAAKALGLSVWSYTGWTVEELLGGDAGEEARDALSSVDVLVDGRFVLARRSESCIYRGSDNQRLIDVAGSIAAGRAVELDRIEL